MADKIIENNQVSITGKIVTGFNIQPPGLRRRILYHGSSGKEA